MTQPQSTEVKPKAKNLLVILGSNNLERSISVAINGVCYDYYFHGDTEEYLSHVKGIMKHTQGGAIKALKKYSHKCIRISK